MGRVARERPTSELGQIGERPSSGRGRAAAMMRSADHEVVVGRRPLPHVTKVEVLHDYVVRLEFDDGAVRIVDLGPELKGPVFEPRSEEHTSELQSRENLVCRLLLEKKKKR